MKHQFYLNFSTTLLFYLQRFSKTLQQHSKSGCHELTNQSGVVKCMRKEPRGVAGQPSAHHAYARASLVKRDISFLNEVARSWKTAVQPHFYMINIAVYIVCVCVCVHVDVLVYTQEFRV